jgi:hypothetical protein
MEEDELNKKILIQILINQKIILEIIKNIKVGTLDQWACVIESEINTEKLLDSLRKYT